MQNIAESLKKQREQVLLDSSEELLGRHTSLLEIALISLYNRLANRIGSDAEEFRASGAVLALGAFGRGLIGPDQPVPILLLRAESYPWKESWLDEIIMPLEEAGWRIEGQQATLTQLIHHAREDFSFLMEVLDARYISGNRQLLEELDKGLESLIEELQSELLGRLYDAVKEREKLLEEAQRWLEPDLEQNPGALRDIAAIRAACRIASNIRSLEDAIFRGYLTRQEVDLLLRAEKTCSRMLSLLRNVSGNYGSVIRFRDQEQLASRLGYTGKVGFLPVEEFMQGIFQLMDSVLCTSQEFWERLHESRIEGDEAPGEVLEEGLLSRSGKIHVQTGQYPPTAAHLIHLFSLAAQKRLGFANVTRQWIQHHRNALDTASGDPSVRKELLDLLQADGAGLPILRRFYNLGLLTSIIPELAPVHGLVQHDAFHLYPVHEHHLRTISELKKLAAGDYSLEEPELTRIAQAINDSRWLLLAGLIHDIGKSSGRDHALHGGEMVPAIARRLGLGPEESDIVQFLVAQHLLLMDSASLRDLADEEMLAHCALAIRTPEHLDLLAVLSFADMAATGPKARQKWRETPVMALHERLHLLLEKGEPSPEAIAERIDHVRAQVRRELADVMDVAELDASFSQLAPRYLLSVSPSAVARHLRLQWRLRHSKEQFIAEVVPSDGTAEITLLSLDIPGLLSRVAGILTLHDLNISSAQVFTMNNGVILLVFQCRLPGQPKEMSDWDAIKEDMGRLLEGRMALDYRIAAHAAKRGYSAKGSAGVVPSQIFIDNESSAVYTILEVYTSDRIGLLYTITRTLYDLQIRISVAKITTKVDQAADVFYIKTQQGEKVTDPEQIEEMKNALKFWLDGSVPGGM